MTQRFIAVCICMEYTCGIALWAVLVGRQDAYPTGLYLTEVKIAIVTVLPVEPSNSKCA